MARKDPKRPQQPEPDRKGGGLVGRIIQRVLGRRPPSPQPSPSYFDDRKEPDRAKERAQAARKAADVAQQRGGPRNSVEEPASFDRRKDDARSRFARESKSDEIKKQQEIDQAFKTKEGRAAARERLAEAEMERQEALKALHEALAPAREHINGIRQNPRLHNDDYGRAINEDIRKAYADHKLANDRIDESLRHDWAEIQTAEWKVNFRTRKQQLLTHSPGGPDIADAIDITDSTPSQSAPEETVFHMPDESVSARIRHFNERGRQTQPTERPPISPDR